MNPRDIRRITSWAAEECRRQHSGELSVGWMVDAWAHAWANRDRSISKGDVITLGRLVEPEDNQYGFRDVRVFIGPAFKPIGSPIERVEEHVDALLEAQNGSDPDSFYIAFEEIHPFRDGNGRVGNILWNWVQGTLETPGVPKDFWAEENEQAYRDHMRALVAEQLWGDIWQPSESTS